MIFSLFNLLAFSSFSAVSPLTSWEDYIFAPLPTNAVGYIKGEIVGTDGDYGTVRAEDFAYLDEAFRERTALLGIYPFGSNTVSRLRADTAGGANRGVEFSFVAPNGGAGNRTRMYISQHGKILNTGWHFIPTDETYTNAVERETYHYITNITNRVSWISTGTNTFRADWPAVVTPVTNAVTNVIFVSGAPIYTNGTYAASAGNYIFGGGLTVLSNLYGRYSFSVPSWPRLSDMTNLYRLVASPHRCVRTSIDWSLYSPPAYHLFHVNDRYGNPSVPDNKYTTTTMVSTVSRLCQWSAARVRSGSYTDEYLSENYFDPQIKFAYDTGVSNSWLSISGGRPSISPVAVFLECTVRYEHQISADGYDTEYLRISTNILMRLNASLWTGTGTGCAQIITESISAETTLLDVLSALGVPYESAAAVETASLPGSGDALISAWARLTPLNSVIVYDCAFRTSPP